MIKKRYAVLEYTRDLEGHWFPTELFAAGLINHSDAEHVKRTLEPKYKESINRKLRIKHKIIDF